MRKTILFLALMATTLFGVQRLAAADTPKFYAYLSSDKKTLYINYDEYYDNHPGYVTNWQNAYNADILAGITKVIIDVPVKYYNVLHSTSHWFDGFKSLKTIEGLRNYVDWSSVTDMSYMFFGCESLESIDISYMPTIYVKDMSNMFSGCKSLKKVYWNQPHTEMVQDMSYMFDNCKALTEITSLSTALQHNTAIVTNMTGMFSGCESLTTLDLSNFQTSNVTSMSSMFSGCSNLAEIKIDKTKFITSNVTQMHSMFSRCSKLTSIDVSGFNTANVTNLQYMFNGCSSLTTLDLSNFNTLKVTDMQYMFNGCSKLTTLDLRSFNPKKLKNTTSMFASCSRLTTIYNAINWSNGVTTSTNMFSGCTRLEGGFGTKFTSSVTNGDYASPDDGADYPGYFTYQPCDGVYVLADCYDPYSNGINKGAYFEAKTFQYPSAPTGLHVVGTPGAREVTVAWTGTGIEEACVIEWSWNNDTQSGYSFCTSTTKTIIGLDPDTEYKVTVQADYGYSHYSDYSTPIYVKTDVLPPCPMPTDLKVTYPSENKAEITWTPGGEETEWWYQFYVNEQKRYEGSCSSAHNSFSGLRPGDQCVFKVKAKCDDQGNESEYAEIAFTVEDQTGIEEIVAPADRAAKYLLDGNLYITTPDGKIYNAQGAEVK